jgi:protein-tyrosine-phosphatase/predicted ATP-grasp superfamily ATP-dependent carboligase
MARLRILILDADSTAGLAILQSLGAAGYRCIAAAKDDRAPAFSSRYVAATACYPDPMKDKTAFQRWIADWVRTNDAALVIPATERTLVPLHEMRDDPEIAKRVAMPPTESIDAALDKERLRELAITLGIAVPPSVCVTSAGEVTDGRVDEWLCEGAAVVKTTKSKVWNANAAVEFPTIIVRDRDELRRAVLERVQYVEVQVQQWVPGRGLGVELLARDGEIVMSIAHERLHEVPLAGGGSSYRRSIPMPPELFADAQRLMRALRYHGVAMVEFRGDAVTGRHWLMEINVRFWGSLPLAIFAGADFPRALTAMLLRDELPTGPPPRDNVYARNIELEMSWFKLILRRRGRFSPYERTHPLGTSLLEWGRIFTGREVWDGANLEDPKPFLREIQRVVGKQLGMAYGKARKLAVQKAARRSSLVRARRFGGAQRVLFVCYGNICRSAYAERRACVRKRIACEIRSAGLKANSAQTTPEEFLRAAKRRGIDLADHRPKRVTLDDLKWADLIVLMDQRNYDLLRELDPKSLRKVVWLGALDGNGIEIEDPYGVSEQRMNEVLERIDGCLDRLTQGHSHRTLVSPLDSRL